MRKIFTGLDFGGRRIKNVKIDDQPYLIPFVFSDDNQSTPVPQEIIDELNHRIDYATEKEIIASAFIITDIKIQVPQIVIMNKSNTEITIAGVLTDYNIVENSNGNSEWQMSQSVKSIIISSDGTWIKQEVSNIRNGNPPAFIIDYENYNSEVYDALSNVPENTIIYIAYDGSLLELRPIPAYGSRNYILVSANDIIGAISSTNDVLGFNINTFIFKLYPDGSKEVYSKIFDLVYGEDGTKFLSDDGTYKEIKSGESFYVVDLNNYTTNVFNELSEMTLGHIIKIITTDDKPILCQLADIEPDYIVLNSYMQYDDSNEDPHIVSYTLNADGTLQDPIERIKLETTGGGTKFLSDLGDYREVKISDLINAKVTQEEYNALEAAGTLDANTIYYIIG